MRSIISKKSLGFIASVMIMTLAMAVPVLAYTVDLTEKGTGAKIGEIEFHNENDTVYFCTNIGETPYDVGLRVRISSAEWDNSAQKIDISGTYSGFEPSTWRSRLIKTYTPEGSPSYRGYDSYLIHTYRGTSQDMGVIWGTISSLNTTSIPSSYVGESNRFNLDAGSIEVIFRNENGNFPIHTNGKSMYRRGNDAQWYYQGATEADDVACDLEDAKLANTETGRITGFCSLVFRPTSSRSEEKKEEKHDDDDDDDKYSKSNSSQSTWRPAPEASKTPAQTAAAQLSTAQTNLTALSVIPAASKEVYKSSGMPLNMTSVNTVDANTTKLITANADIPYNVTFNFMGKPMVCTIPAGFNYAQFTKADGTMNIHEVLWAVYTGSWKKTNTRTTTRGRR